jgi:hypothetical protein
LPVRRAGGAPKTGVPTAALWWILHGVIGVVSSSSASAAMAAACTATTLGSATVDDVECCFFGWKWFLWCGVKFCSMKINVGMTPTKIPKVLI